MDMDRPAAAPRVAVAEMRPVALITGASSGIGAALAHVFARSGHEVVLAARRVPQLAAIAESIRAAGHRAPHIIPVDLTRADSAEHLAQELAARDLAPAFLVNNAGYGLLGLAAKLDRHEQLAMIDLNCRSLTDLSLRWINSLARHRGGILNLASISGWGAGRMHSSVCREWRRVIRCAAEPGPARRDGELCGPASAMHRQEAAASRAGDGAVHAKSTARHQRACYPWTASSSRCAP